MWILLPLVVPVALVLLFRRSFQPWKLNTDQRFGNKNYEPPIELGLSEASKDGKTLEL